MKRHLLLLTLLVSAFVSAVASGGRGKKSNKTIRDSVFAEGDIIQLPEISFFPSAEYGKMNQGTKDSLNIVADFMRKHPNVVFELVSYTDYKGTFFYNNRLSRERSNTCVRYLISERHIDPSRIKAKGAGEYFLLASQEEIMRTDSKEEKQKMRDLNDRIELVVKKVD